MRSSLVVPVIPARSAGIIIIIIGRALLIPSVRIIRAIIIRIGPGPPWVIIVMVPVTAVVRIVTAQFGLARQVTFPVAHLVV
jgi:hypothetical protein